MKLFLLTAMLLTSLATMHAAELPHSPTPSIWIALANADITKVLLPLQAIQIEA